MKKEASSITSSNVSNKDKIKVKSFSAVVAYRDVNIMPGYIDDAFIEFTLQYILSSCFTSRTLSVTPFQQHITLNPGVKGLRVFAAIKRARLIPESIFRNTHTQDMHTCMHGEQTTIIFGLPCHFSSSQLSGLLPCVVWLKMERGTQPPPLLCGRSV